jgi:hypothetical protein
MNLGSRGADRAPVNTAANHAIEDEFEVAVDHLDEFSQARLAKLVADGTIPPVAVHVICFVPAAEAPFNLSDCLVRIDTQELEQAGCEWQSPILDVLEEGAAPDPWSTPDEMPKRSPMSGGSNPGVDWQQLYEREHALRLELEAGVCSSCGWPNNGVADATTPVFGP